MHSNLNFLFQKQLKKDQKSELKEAFDIFDPEKTGQIDFNQLKGILRALGFTDTKKADVQKLAKDYDANNTGMIDFEDYLDLSLLKSDP